MSESDHVPPVPAPEPVLSAPAAAPVESAPTAEPTAPPTDGGGEATPGEAGPGGERRRRRRRRGRGKHRDGAPGQDGPGEGQGPGDGPGHGEGQGPRPPRPPRPHQHQHQHQHQHGRDRNRGRADSQHQALFAVKALARMAQSLLKIEGVDPLSMPRFVDLSLRIPLDERIDARTAAGTAVEQILQRVREVREHERALKPGAVYSYFADSADADGCRPSEPRQVFEGFNSTGKPVFSDFVTMAIERKDPAIERLLAGDDVVLTHVQMGRVLRTQQLAEFGGNSPVYKILGQVNAGLFRVLGAEGKCAFSFQLLRGKTLEGKIRLRLHAVGAVDLMDIADPSVLNILTRCQRFLDGEAMRLQGMEQNGPVDDEEFARPLLEELAARLSGMHKRQARRTEHARDRADEGQRPTPRAYPDAGEAGDEDILWDTEKGTVVVLGGKGRVHIFTPDARHVTSVMMQGGAIHNRRHTGRWRAAEPEERGEFRIQLRLRVQSGEDKPTDADAPLD